MSQYFLLGGFIGFAMTFFLSFAGGATVHTAARNGMIGCLIMALVVSQFAKLVMRLMIEARLRQLDRKLEEESGEGS